MTNYASVHQLLMEENSFWTSSPNSFLTDFFAETILEPEHPEMKYECFNTLWDLVLLYYRKSEYVKKGITVPKQYS